MPAVFRGLVTARFAGGRNRPALRLLLLHDDKAGEFDYVAGAEKSLELARSQGWTAVTIKDDCSRETFYLPRPPVR